MIDLPRREWFERSFALGLPIEALPEILERLRGTPLRLAERLGGLRHDVLIRHPPNQWSALEHAGHLADLEPLWLGRVEDLLSGLGRLRQADLQNRATWDAAHNSRSVDDVLADFRTRRDQLMARLESMSVPELLASAKHPRLDQPMTTVDLCFFVAEHDDHHLATITALTR